MIPQSMDTDREVEEKLVSLIRRTPVSRRLSHMRSLSQTVLALSRRALSRANAPRSDRERAVLFVRYFYGDRLAEKFHRWIDRPSA
jgi:hypothetical protein